MWRVAAASAIGTSHIKTGTPCQDSTGVEFIDTADGQVLVCVISDGAGSAAHSDIGSRQAVTRSLELVREFLSNGGQVQSIDAGIAADWLANVRSSIVAIAEETNSTSREFACTVLVAIIAAEMAAFFQVGDGAMVFSCENEDAWSNIIWPQHGEYANSTNFVTSTDSLDVMEFKRIDCRVERFASFSDGIESLVLHYATKAVHAPFFSEMVKPVEKLDVPGLSERLSRSLFDYLCSTDVCDRTDDDKSLILASRKPFNLTNELDVPA
jgi:Protein phosphatase 2C